MAEPGLDPSTLAVTAGRGSREPGEPVNPPVELSSTFHYGAPFGYGRSRNATWEALEGAVGALEGAPGLAFSSGMAAIAATASLVQGGGVVVVDSGGYHGTRALLHDLEQRALVRVRAVDTADAAELSAAAAGAAMVWLETPTNPLMGIVDLAAAVASAHAAGALVAVDNTFATPLRQRPFDAGADVVVHSVSKLLSGHSDLVLGMALARDADVLDRLRAHRTIHGAIAAPMEAFLALRGLRTLAVRLDRAEATAALLVDHLRGHPAVIAVRWPGLPEHPGHDLARRQMRGFGAMVSFDVDGAEAAELVCSATKLIINATSLGGVETLIERRGRYEPEVTRVPPGLLRLSDGLEHPDDLWADLCGALDRIR